jgi:hypothetical protein
MGGALVRHLALLIVLGAAACGVTQADVITTFVASGDFGPPAGPPVTFIDFGGTITIDTTIGQVTAADIKLGFQSPATTVTFTGITPTFHNPMGPTDIVLFNGAGDLFSFQVNASDLVGYTGGSLLNAFLFGPGLPETGGDFTPDIPAYKLTAQTVPEPGGLAGLAALLFVGFGLLRAAHYSSR